MPDFSLPTNPASPCPAWLSEIFIAKITHTTSRRSIFIWFGAMKFTAYEANGIAPFIINSPIMSWLHSLFGTQGASYVIAVLQLAHDIKTYAKHLDCLPDVLRKIHRQGGIEKH
jgi:hypothetical protein